MAFDSLNLCTFFHLQTKCKHINIILFCQYNLASVMCNLTLFVSLKRQFFLHKIEMKRNSNNAHICISIRCDAFDVCLYAYVCQAEISLCVCVLYCNGLWTFIRNLSHHKQFHFFDRSHTNSMVSDIFSLFVVVVFLMALHVSGHLMPKNPLTTIAEYVNIHLVNVYVYVKM